MAKRLSVSPPFDLARTAAPAWWARGRWPNVDWRRGGFIWVGWDAGNAAWRRVRQVSEQTLEISGSRDEGLDDQWAAAVLGTTDTMPAFADPVLAVLAREHAGLRPWAAGSLFEGVVASIVGQSISLAAAATTERRLYERFNRAVIIGDREFWPPPLPEQLAYSSPAFVRESGVTTKRAEALVAVGQLFASELGAAEAGGGLDSSAVAEQLRGIPGIGPWTVRSALLWGLAAPDAYPSGDVALLRAARARYEGLSGMKDLDLLAERWRPHRGWAARLLWLDLLGHDPAGMS